jgi:hypothetical protein
MTSQKVKNAEPSQKQENIEIQVPIFKEIVKYKNA